MVIDLIDSGQPRKMGLRFPMIKSFLLAFEAFFAALFRMSGDMAILLIQSIIELRNVHRRIPAVLAHMVEIGWNTLPLAALIGLFTGMVMALQTGYALKDWNMETEVGPIVGLTLIREMGPVITAVLVAGRVGSAMAAEIGTMAVTDEIDALRSLGINPVSYLVMPRFLAALIMQPILTVFNIVIGIWGGQMITTSYFKLSPQIFYERMYSTLKLIDLTGGMSKTFVFGVLIVIISCYMGLTTRHGVAGVGRSTTMAVVISLTTIFVSNFFITRFYGLG